MKKMLLFLALLPMIAFAQHQTMINWTEPAAIPGTHDDPTSFKVYTAPSATGTFMAMTTGNCSTSTFVTGTTSYSCVDTAVVAGQTKVYQITALNSGGESTPSNQFTCVTPFQAPSAPTIVSAESK